MSTWTLAVARCGAHWLARVVQFAALMRPRIALLVLVVVAVSAYVAGGGRPDPVAVAQALLGTLLVAGSATAWNQWLERRRDGLMARTARRPLPAGHLPSAPALVFAVLTAAGGGLYLALAVNRWAALWAGLAWAIYVAVYTPLKSRTPLHTAVGAVAGALPVLIGWSAAGGNPPLAADPRSGALFLVLFLWQFPHFLAIAWIYRAQYAAAGFRLLTVVDPSGRRAARLGLLAAGAVLPISLVPAGFLSAGAALGYSLAACTLAGVQLAAAVRFHRCRSEATARGLLRATLLYLPLLLAALAAATWVTTW